MQSKSQLLRTYLIIPIPNKLFIYLTDRFDRHKLFEVDRIAAFSKDFDDI